MIRCRCLFALLLCSSFAFAQGNTAQHSKTTLATHLLVTTSSPAAREHFERAMRYFEGYDLKQTLADLR